MRLATMTAPIEHRGPDDEGHWVDAERGVGLGFRRLAILDLSAAGHQPMRSASGRFQMVFNGEVYNHRDLREAMGPHAPEFRGHSDSEVLLAAVEHWGVRDALKRFNGMFAIALWDREERCLYLARDRMGIKPMYVQNTGKGLLFGSELKALRPHPDFRADLDPQGVGEYLRWLYVAAPRTVLASTVKLLPGHFMRIEDPRVMPDPEAFWSLGPGGAPECSGDLKEATGQLDVLLRDAVRTRMEADVPLGALLSGGVDSSTVVAMMQAQASRPIRTFSIGFDQKEHDESHHAQAVADFLGTEHTPFHLTSADALDVVPNLASMFDEPLADPSQIPTYLVCQLARESVTVALSGDGGDELFGGYNRYRFGPRWAGLLGQIPKPVRSRLGAALLRPSTQAWDGFGRRVLGSIPGLSAPRLFGEKMGKIGQMALANPGPDMIESLSRVGWDPHAVGSREFFGDDAPVPNHRLRTFQTTDEQARMMAADQLTYLPDDLLAKVDRASMAVSLEVRVPLLDHRVVEFSWNVPTGHKLGSDGGKTILKKVLYNYVPPELVHRPKVGFTPPVSDWLAGSLKPWANDLIASGQGGMGEVWDREAVLARWEAFLGGHRSHALGLWALLLFQAWHEDFLSA